MASSQEFRNDSLVNFFMLKLNLLLITNKNNELNG
jgi:hypothetical protein